LVDGIHVQARLEEEARCLLVIVGATPEGKKDLAYDSIFVGAGGPPVVLRPR
jgi:hypothetical protein